MKILPTIAAAVLLGLAFWAINANAASAHFIGELNAKGYADTALWNRGNEGATYSTVSANAGQGTRTGDHSYIFNNGSPWALRRREWTLPPRDWCYGATVKVTHTTVVSLTIWGKQSC